MRSPGPTVTVVVPATDRPASLARCRAGLAESLDAADELLVVEGGSARGPAEARNRGLALARGEIVLFVDSDVVVEPGTLGGFRAAFAADPRLSALFGAYDDAPTAPGTVSRFRNLLHHHVHVGAAGRAETFWAGLGAVRRAEALSVGGFDEQRFPHASIEDIEFGGRLVAAGGRIELDPTLRGAHLKRWTLIGMVRTDFSRRAVPWVRLIVRTRSAPPVLNLGWRHRVGALAALAVLVCAARGRPRASAAALCLMVATEPGLYLLLARRTGVRGALAGVGLRALHHLTAIAAVPVGVAAELADR